MFKTLSAWVSLDGITIEQNLFKLDGVGPVDNRPATDKLHHFVQKKKKNK